MILDRIENAEAYGELGSGIASALRYLARTSFDQAQEGARELDGQRLLVIVQRYQPRTMENVVWESHRRYIDVQFVAAGVERMGWRSLAALPDAASDYDQARDVIFYQPGEGAKYFSVGAGEFTIFGPRDVHAPGLETTDVAAPRGVLKVVLKVEIDGAWG